MSFPKMTRPKFPLRQWAIMGEPLTGKSTFAARMKAPILPIDADHRWDTVMDLVAGDSLQWTTNPADHTNVHQIAKVLNEGMDGTVGTIVVDSLTNIVVPLITMAMMDFESGDAKNLAAAFHEKAVAMRLLTTTINSFGVPVLYIYHKSEARNERGQKVERESISKVELARLQAELGATFEIVMDGDRRGVRVVHCRRGREGMTLWDADFRQPWLGMPERLEEAMYGGLTEEQMRQIEAATPKVFKDPSAAWAWGIQQGAFTEPAHAKNAYEKLKADEQPESAEEMATLWVADVRRRVAEKQPKQQGQLL